MKRFLLFLTLVLATAGALVGTGLAEMPSLPSLSDTTALLLGVPFLIGALANYTPNSKTLSAIRTGDADALAEAWSAMAILEANKEDDLSLLEGGNGSEKPIHEKTDLKAGRGQLVRFNVYGELGGQGKRGSTVLKGNTENPIEDSFSVKVDLIRHGIAHKLLVEQMTNTGKSRSELEWELLGRWYGRKTKMDKLMRWINSATSANTLRPDGKTRDTLLSADVMSTRIISDAQGFLVTLNGAPVYVGKASAGNDIHGYLFYGTNDGLRSLKSEDDWIQAQRHAAVRGQGNGIFSGDIREWDGNVIWNANVPDKPTYGPMGSAMAPKAKLGDGTQDAGTTLVSGSNVDFASESGDHYVFGSGVLQSTLGDFAGAYYYPFEHFPGYAYKWCDDDSPSADSSTRYAIIYDPSDRKWMTFQYTGSTNLGYRITMTTRLGASTTGSRSTTHLGFTYDSAVNKESFPIGSWIFPCNAKGVPFGYTLALGAGSLFSAFGADRFSRREDMDDFDEDQGVAIRSINGCNVPTNALAAITGYVLIEHAVNHANCSGLPEVTS